jgi:anti-anti-sigma regulatory factor
MTTNASWIQDAVDKVNAAESEVILDFSPIQRIDGNAVAALEELAAQADSRKVKVVLRGVSVDIYRVLKQLKLAHRFAYTT